MKYFEEWVTGERVLLTQCAPFMLALDLDLADRLIVLQQWNHLPYVA